MNRKAIFTIACGGTYLANWRSYCEPNWRKYADKHGYDIVVVTEPIRQEHELARRPVNWQKCFVLSHPEAARYEDVVFLDADIVINYNRAPCIAEANDSEKIGAVSFDRYLDDDLQAYMIGIRKGNFLTYERRMKLRKTNPGPMQLPPVDFSTYYDLYPGDCSRLPRVNSGVLAMKPALHRELMESIYFDSFKETRDEWVDGTLEIDQTYLTYKLLRADAIKLLDRRFNRIASFEQAIHYPFTLMVPDEKLLRTCFTSMLCNSYFLHFARCAGMMKHAVANDEGDFAILGLPNVFAGDRISIKHRGPRTLEF